MIRKPGDGLKVLKIYRKLLFVRHKQNVVTHWKIAMAFLRLVTVTVSVKVTITFTITPTVTNAVMLTAILVVILVFILAAIPAFIVPVSVAAIVVLQL